MGILKDKSSFAKNAPKGYRNDTLCEQNIDELFSSGKRKGNKSFLLMKRAKKFTRLAKNFSPCYSFDHNLLKDVFEENLHYSPSYEANGEGKGCCSIS